MKTYLVGGAVRDKIMGITPKDLDFVVVGSSPAEMLSLGYKKVGADFEVFLHPITGDEYALARKERKTGTGYTGFECEWEGVTLEEDLSRRDLTINSMAQDLETGEIIDPFGGVEDIKRKRLRHTSSAFSDDPVRILRVARFLARFGAKWSIHEDTVALMDEIYYSGELSSLVPERVFLETKKALSERTPSLYFTTLYRYGIFEEIDMLYGVPQKVSHHPETEHFIARL